MTDSDGRRRAHALVDELVGPSDETADRAVEVLRAHAAALAWVRDTTGSYPAPPVVTAALNEAATALRSGADWRDPVAVLGRAAVEALTAYRSTTAT